MPQVAFFSIAMVVDWICVQRVMLTRLLQNTVESILPAPQEAFWKRNPMVVRVGRDLSSSEKPKVGANLRIMEGVMGFYGIW